MRTTALLTCERGLCCCRLIAAAHTLRLLSLLCREQSTFNMKANIKIKFNIQHSTFNIQKVPSIETGSIVCSLAHWLSRSHPTCEEQCIFLFFRNSNERRCSSSSSRNRCSSSSTQRRTETCCQRYHQRSAAPRFIAFSLPVNRIPTERKYLRPGCMFLYDP